jgi:hypothetical protein
VRILKDLENAGYSKVVTGEGEEPPRRLKSPVGEQSWHFGATEERPYKDEPHYSISVVFVK